MNVLYYGLIILFIVFLIKLIFGRKILFFGRPDCGYCQRMQPEWHKFEKMCHFAMINPKYININEEINRAMADDYGVSGVPHIVKLKSDGNREVYNGERTADALYEWASHE